MCRPVARVRRDQPVVLAAVHSSVAAVKSVYSRSPALGVRSVRHVAESKDGVFQGVIEVNSEPQIAIVLLSASDHILEHEKSDIFRPFQDVLQKKSQTMLLSHPGEANHLYLIPAIARKVIEDLVLLRRSALF